MKNWAAVFIIGFLAVGSSKKTIVYSAPVNDAETVSQISGENAELLREKRSTISQGQTPAAGRRSRIVLPAVPFSAEYLEKSRMIFHAHQILFGPLFEYFRGRNDVPAIEDLNNVLNQFKNNYPQYFNLNTAPRNFRDRFYQIYHQRNEVCHQSYSIDCFDLDKEVLIEVARYLAGQSNVSNRDTLVQSLTNALNYHGPSTRSSGSINCSRYSTDSTFSSRRADRSTPRPIFRPTMGSSISRQQIG